MKPRQSPQGPEPRGSGYCGYIQPGHSVLERVFPPLGEDRRSDLSRSLETLRGPGFRYDLYRGPVGFDHLADRLSRAGDEAVPLNCLTTASLLVSRLRAAGYTADQAFVVLGKTASRSSQYGWDFHAWVLLRDGDATTWIDTAELEPRKLDEVRAASVPTPYVVFNDHRLYFGAEAKRLLRGLRGGAGPRCYLFGQGDPALGKLVASPEWRALVKALLESDGRLALEAAADFAGLDEAVAVGLCRREDGFVSAGPKLDLVRESDIEAFRGVFQPFLASYLAILQRALPRLESAFGECRTGRDFAWPQVAHGVVAGILMDLSVGGHLQLYERLSASRGPTLVCAFETLPGGNAFGVRWMAGRRSEFLELWHQGLRREPLALKPQVCELLRDVALGQHAGQPEILWLRHLKLVTGRGRGLRPNLPTFFAPDALPLIETAQEVAREITDRAVSPALRASARGGGVGAGDPGGISFAGARLVLELATDAAVEARLLPAFPATDEAPENWGRWLWIRLEEGPSLRDLLHAGPPPAGREG